MVVAFAMIIGCGLFLVLPVRNMKIGRGKRIYTKWQWASVTLCTTIATGILFWGTAEPLYHFADPPAFLNLTPQSTQAKVFSLSTMFMHWCLSPYAIYSLTALMFAIGHYNYRLPFSFLSGMFTIIPQRYFGSWSVVVDIICLFGLLLGMAASLGAGILILSGSLGELTAYSAKIWQFYVCLLIVMTFTLSSISGLQRGIKRLSQTNVVLFFILLFFVLITIPASYLISVFFPALADYILHFIPRSLALPTAWSKSWTMFYWANWMAWAPVTALFLGRISKGYTVKQFLIVNWLLPSLFGMLWMGVFSGAAFYMTEHMDVDLVTVLYDEGPRYVSFNIMQQLNGGWVPLAVFLVAVFISYVTAADSNTDAMSGICTKGYFSGNNNPSLSMKIIWGCLLGGISYVMIASGGIEGIKMLSNIGGFPVMLLLIGVIVAAVRLLRRACRK